MRSYIRHELKCNVRIGLELSKEFIVIHSAAIRNVSIPYSEHFKDSIMRPLKGLEAKRLSKKI